MTQYLIIHFIRDHFIIILLLVCYLGQGFWYRELQILLKTKSRLFRKCVIQCCCCDLAYAVAKCEITRHMDHVPNVQNHVYLPNIFFDSSILSSHLLYTLASSTMATGNK